jgi:hypothetical protein
MPTLDELQKLLDEPIYSLDAVSLLSGLVDFLMFSESNLAWQREREIYRARQEAEALEFGSNDAHLLTQARRQIIESAKLRFDIGLSQSVRYAGVVAYVTAIEWCMKLFAARLLEPLPPKPKGKNQAVHTFEQLIARIAVPMSNELSNLERVVYVRNCIVHSTGLLKDDPYETAVRTAIAGLDGFSISHLRFLGDEIHVSAGAVDKLACSALTWVPKLDKECAETGVFKPRP